MCAQSIVLSTPEAREALAALDALGGPEAARRAGVALLEAIHTARSEIRLELSDARRRTLDAALAAREAELRTEREARLHWGDATAAGIYEELAGRVSGTRVRLEAPLLAAVA